MCPEDWEDTVWSELQDLITAADPPQSDRSTSQPPCKKWRGACVTSPLILMTRHYSYHKQILPFAATNLKRSLMRIEILWSGGSHMLVLIKPLLHWLTSIWQHPPQLFHVRDSSASGNIVNKKCASLSADNVNKLVCLYNWLKRK